MSVCLVGNCLQLSTSAPTFVGCRQKEGGIETDAIDAITPYMERIQEEAQNILDEIAEINAFISQICGKCTKPDTQKIPVFRQNQCNSIKKYLQDR